MAYSQQDPRWKNTKIGFDTGPTDTIGNYGCYMTAIANVCVWAEHDVNPSQVNDLCKQNSWLVKMDTIARDDIPALICNNLTFEGRTNWTDAVSMNFFADASDPNVAYIIKIDTSPASGVQEHFVMVWQTDGPNDLIIDDSWDGVRKPLSHYGNPSVIIYSAMKFRKNTVTPPQPPALPYSIQSIDPKQITFTKQPTYAYDLHYQTFEEVSSHPVGAVNPGDVKEAVAELHHNNGYVYYLEDANNPIGWNVLDCTTDYTPPVYVPPAAPVPVKLTETYNLVTTLPYYASATDVQADKNAVGTLSPKKNGYVVWEKQGIFWNLTTDNQTDQHKWVNTLDNKELPKTDNISPPPMDKPVIAPNPAPIPPEVDPAIMNWHGTMDLRYAGMYVFMNHNTTHDPTVNSVDIYDLETGQVKKSTANGTYAQFSGKVKWTDGNWYGRMRDSDSTFHWYAAHIEDLQPYDQVYSTRTTLQERSVLHTLTAMDRLELSIAKIKTLGSGIWDILVPKGKK